MDEDSEDESHVYAVESDPTYRVNSRHDDEDFEEDNALDDGEDEEILESDDSDSSEPKKKGQRSVGRILINCKSNLVGKPKGPNSSFLVNDIGFVVRTYAPLNVKQWRNVEKKDVDKMIERITVSNIFISHFCYIQYSKYDIDMSLTHVSTYIKNALQRRFVDFRHKLKKHFDSFLTLEEANQNKHEDVTSQEEWNFLCDRYASDQFKVHVYINEMNCGCHERSNKNAINRSHLTYNHKGRSKSFRAYEEEIEAKTGEQLSAIDYFEAVHKNTKNEMLSVKNETTLPDGMVTLTDDEIILGVLGHKSGYFKGPSKSQELVTTKQELGEAKQEIQELKENQKKFEELLHKIMEGQQPPP
ncbi:hypothetical protein DVH24_041700 [Malus domestica]|uniref:Uncharacterized protein n=1 Tax=Malus domestica TaxID=3750 RepID=A0A498ISQ2_MALDO|nr:hypothetical protein DVH24_041700 [Malus domestica]